jgi:hypothetical protein
MAIAIEQIRAAPRMGAVYRSSLGWTLRRLLMPKTKKNRTDPVQGRRLAQTWFASKILSSASCAFAHSALARRRLCDPRPVAPSPAALTGPRRSFGPTVLPTSRAWRRPRRAPPGTSAPRSRSVAQVRACATSRWRSRWGSSNPPTRPSFRKRIRHHPVAEHARRTSPRLRTRSWSTTRPRPGSMRGATPQSGTDR